MAANEKSPKDDDPLSRLCFVVGPIGKEGSPERKHADLLLNAVIKHVLEGGEFGYKVKRADEDADPGMIGDRVITDIIKSALVVADLTDLNPNAFYELGIRHSIELPTIHMAKTGTALPFDNVAHRTIFVDLMDWHSIENARSRLADSVRAIKAADYRVSNPITQANASFKMRQSEDPRDRVIAQMSERLAALENTIVAPSGHRQLSDESQSRLYDELINVVQTMRRQGTKSPAIVAAIRQTASDFGARIHNVEFSKTNVSSKQLTGYVTTYQLQTEQRVGRIRRRRYPPFVRDRGGGLRSANPPYALIRWQAHQRSNPTDD